MSIRERVTIQSEIEGDRATIAGLEKIESSVENAESAAASFGGRVSKEMRDARAATEQAEQATRSYARAADRAETSTRAVSSAASSTATDLGFELTQAAQDAQFGLAGVANQVPLISEQFTRLRSQAGSTRGALRSLLSTFLGPTGLLALGTLGLQALPSILEFFQGIGEGAEKADQKISETLQSVFDFSEADLDQIGEDVRRVNVRISTLRDRLNELRGEGLSPGARRAQQLFPSDPIEQVQTALRTLESVDSQSAAALPGSAIRDVVESVEGVEDPANNAQRALRQVLSGLRGERRRERQIATLEQKLQDLNNGLDKLIQKRDEVARQVRVQKELRDANVQSLEREAEATEDVADEEERRQRLRRDIDLQRLDALEGFGRSRFRTRRQALRRQLRQDVSELEIATPEYIESAEQAGQTAEDEVNQKIVRGIQLAGQLGETLASAFQEGEVEATKLYGQILQIVGSAVAIANPYAGAAVSGLGGIISSFESGGYTGAGAASRPAGIVHAGEYVMPKSAVEAAGGPAVFEQMQKMLTGSMSKSDLRRVAGMPPGYQGGGLVRSLPSSPSGESSSDVVSELRRQAEELSRLRRDLQRFADRPNLVRVDRRASRDIVETGQDYQRQKDPRQRG